VPQPPPGAGAPGQESRIEPNWWDRQAAGYAEWMLWVHLCICQCPGLIVGLLFSWCCRTPEGKNTGTRLLMYSAAGVGVAILVRIILAALSAVSR
jgi:hypothetical protein